MVVFLNLLHVLCGELTCLIREMIPRLIGSQFFHEQGVFPFRVDVQLLVQGRPEVLLIFSSGVLLFVLHRVISHCCVSVIRVWLQSDDLAYRYLKKIGFLIVLPENIVFLGMK